LGEAREVDGVVSGVVVVVVDVLALTSTVEFVIWASEKAL
jgi:hypothetical protein